VYLLFARGSVNEEQTTATGRDVADIEEQNSVTKPTFLAHTRR